MDSPTAIPFDRCGGLDARCGVDDVSGDETLTALRSRVQVDDDLAGVHADAHREGAGSRLTESLDNAQRRPHRALGVVLVRDGRAEDRHHGVSDELLHGAAERLDVTAQLLVVSAEVAMDVLRILELGGRGEAGEVAEQDADRLALPPAAARSGRERRAASGNRTAHPRDSPDRTTGTGQALRKSMARQMHGPGPEPRPRARGR